MQSFPRATRLILCFSATATFVAAGFATAADPDQVAQLMNTGHCAMCNLEDGKLSGLPLEGADLSGANLTNAELYGTNLKNANLAGAILQGANLKMANLAGARDAVLAGAQTDERTTCPNGGSGPCE